MNAATFLETLIKDYQWACNQPALARAAILANRTFPTDKFAAMCVRALMICEGDWRAAAAWLDDVKGIDRARVAKFKKWADKLTQPKKPLLLEWKGGAS